MENYQICQMSADHYERVIELWRNLAGVILTGADSRVNYERYLQRNPGLSLVAREGENIIGAVLCGHDGRRGYLHHLAVREDCRRRGLGRELVRRCLEKLREAGIEKCHLFMVKGNNEGLVFWSALGWQKRDDIDLLSKMSQSESKGRFF